MHNNLHVPVMLHETIAALEIQPGSWYVDCTFGQGGHTKPMLERGAKVLAFDWDAAAIQRGETTYAQELAAGTLILVHEPFSKLSSVIEPYKQTGMNIMGILFDFGTSSPQLTSGERGFSFLSDGELDMRMDTRLGVQAKDLLAILPEKQLAQLFSEFGGEHEAKTIAHAIKLSSTPITTTLQLAHLV